MATELRLVVCTTWSNALLFSDLSTPDSKSPLWRSLQLWRLFVLSLHVTCFYLFTYLFFIFTFSYMFYLGFLGELKGVCKLNWWLKGDSRGGFGLADGVNRTVLTRGGHLVTGFYMCDRCFQRRRLRLLFLGGGTRSC